MSEKLHPGVTDRGTGVAKRYRYMARFRASGTHREITKCHPTMNAANEWLAAQRVARSAGMWIDPASGKMRLEPWSAKWLESVRHNLKPSTYESYRSLVESRVLPTFGNWQLAAIQASDIKKWLGEMSAEELSASRRRKCLIVLRLMLDAAVEDRLILHNAARDVKAPKIERVEAAYFEPAQVDKIAEHLGGQYGLLVLVLGRLGLRFGEAAGLERRHIDVMRRRLKVEQSATEVAGEIVVGPTKNYQQRSVPVPRSLMAELVEHLERNVGTAPNASVFTGPRGGRLRHSAFYGRVWSPALRSVGLPKVGPHVLRHSAAALLISSGANAKTVQQILGHRSAAFTLTVYGHLFDSDLDDLAERLESFTTRNERGMAPTSDTPTSVVRGV